MAFTKEELEQWDAMVASYVEENRPPKHIRSQVDLGYAIQNQSIEIFEIRPRFDNPEEKVHTPGAKATWVRRQKIWKVYWQRADLKWHKYDPLSKVNTLAEFLQEVDEDPFACFWG